MLLSRNEKERHAQYRNLIRRECAASRDERAGANRRLKQIALTGSDTIQPALYPMIWEFVRDANADILAPDNIQFSVSTPPHYGGEYIEECEAAREEFHRIWHDSNAGLAVSLAGQWARVYGTMVGKVLTDEDEATLMLIADPSDIGVSNEAHTEWDKKHEAICHWYEPPLSTLRRMIYPIMDEKLRRNIWLEAQGAAQPPTHGALDALGPAMAGIVLSAVSPNVTGTANLRGSDPARPRVDEDCVKVAELWVWDDEAIPLCDKCHLPFYAERHIPGNPLFNHEFKPGGGWEGDYRVATVLLSSNTEPIIKEPINPLLQGEHPFHGLTLHPAPGYIWGLSQVEQLYPLQNEAMTVLNDILDRLGKQADPPMVASGYQGVLDEKLKVLRKRGGQLIMPLPGAKVDPFVIPMPPEAFAVMEELRKMFDRLGGRRSRQREPGMRSGDQVMAEASLAGGPQLEEAKRAQQWIEGVATQMFRLHRRVHRATLKKYDHEKGAESEFLLSQMPGDVVVRVESNSSSPIHRQEIMAKVAFAAQQKAIDPDDLIRLLGLPYEYDLMVKARRRAKNQAAVQEEVLKMKKEEADSKKIKALAAAQKA